MLAVHNDNEKAAAKQFRAEATRDLVLYIIIREKGHNETISSAIDLFRRQFVPNADPFTAKR
jgi:rubrerythrin